MNGRWRTRFLFVLLIAIAAVLVWSGYLGYRWTQGYSVGKLIAIQATSNEPRFNSPDWEDMLGRRNEIDERLERLERWQRETAFTTALEGWFDCAPRRAFGTAYFWHLLFCNNADLQLIEGTAHTALGCVFSLGEMLRWASQSKV